jgi:hypothetical protein
MICSSDEPPPNRHKEIQDTSQRLSPCRDELLDVREVALRSIARSITTEPEDLADDVLPDHREDLQDALADAAARLDHWRSVIDSQRDD